MIDFEILTAFVTNVLFVTVLGWYLITNLQWYDYKLSRVVLKHHKPHWHLIYFFIPFIAYHTTGRFFPIFFFFALLPWMLVWYNKLDKKLIFTWRVKRFMILLISLVFFQDVLCTLKGGCGTYGCLCLWLLLILGV